ncbi:insulinase family protein [Agathobacter rectalis]|jgi:Zn-dependent M16 (insulinase) family peptidase|uniref:Insulinase family protein n=1 Tax=Agathobacter rectalis TaxID=39491 RepID=A0A395V1D8_9FIRM|nr:insulinase family protein [Agathobacter rectalis]HAX67941.1 peptidase M16 [Eubacterium sp.]RGK42524.1 insulinase family protein [Agathobacter rectalis]RGM72241.1 insulinase family protein [Agathobacter rectalis]RGR56982.1 insulinase family protein [Agathobacter rectalis]RGT79208.1 insulinase family protein [Agathobacter rectalis]
MTIHDLAEYEILDEHRVEDVQSDGFILRHKKSGARIAILSNNDDNKVFYIGFRTPPEDETGVPHIIEHTTLCGSKKFPVKDPFIELAKGSLNTFLNAMTYPDKTVYPVASCNDQDFKNLMDVYLDAVFNPNITKYEEIFKQEGWHYELTGKDDELKINGVVYNEMKGAYSSPDEVLSSQIYRSLFPDNTYSKDSGGNPEYIPKLTYEAYLDFYHKYYHPSNSYIYLYGDMDVVERLEWLDKEYLSLYDYKKVNSEINKQPAFDEIKNVEAQYSITMDDSQENKTYLSYNRVVGDSLDEMLYQAFDVLDYALVSSPGAPVKQALIDAGIGDDVYGSYDAGILQPVFSFVAKNANASQADEFESIIENTLKEVVKTGINKEALLAGINSSEFKFREADFGQFPKGLLFGLNCLDSWLFDDMKPFIHLECLDTFAKLRRAVDTDYFEKLIQEYLLDNTHGSSVTVKPKRGLGNEREEALAKELSDYKASLSDEEIDKLIEETEHLKKYQEEPSSDEDLRKLPMLTRADMKKEAMPFSNIEDTLSDVKVVRHDIESNGIDYISFLFDAGDFAQSELGYLGFFTNALGLVSTENYSYTDLANATNIYTGGISTGTASHPDIKDRNNFVFKFEVKLKVLEKNLDKALELMEQMLLSSDFTDTKRLGEIVAQIKARLQANLSSSGHLVAAMRSMSSFSRYALYQDELKGIAFYRSICRIEKELFESPESVSDKLAAIAKKLFARNRMLISFTGNSEAYGNAKLSLEKVIAGFNKMSAIGNQAEVHFNTAKEAFIDASQIQYVAKTGDFICEGYEYTGALRLLRIILSYDYLWINVRVKGGAYGCMNTFLRSGESYFVSYRDPNLSDTLDVYDRIPEYIKSFSPDERDMTKYIIGTFSALDTPMNPEAKGSRSLSAYLEGITYEQIQKERNEILNAQPEDIRRLADLVEAVLKKDSICVIGNENMIKESAGLFENVEKLI